MTSANQLGIGVESSWGTAVTPTRFYEYTGEGLEWERERIDSAAWRAGQRVISSARWKPGQVNVSGNVDLEVASRGFGIWFQHALGAGTTIAAGTTGGTVAYQQSFTLGSLTNLGLTVQVGAEDQGGTVRPFTFSGMKVQSMALACSVGELLTGAWGLIGRNMVTATALAAASYPASQELFSFVEGALTIGGTAVPVREFSLEVANNLPTDDYVLGSQFMRQPQEPAIRAVTGSLDADFASLDLFNLYVNGTEASLVLDFQTPTVIAGTLVPRVRITANTRFDGETPKVGGPEAVRQPLNYTVTAPAAGEPLTIAYVTLDTTP